MTQEEKQLLLKDLCARLPYGVIIEGLSGPVKLSDYYSRIDITKARLYKPYLRPMDSITGQEENEWHNLTLGQRWITLDNVEQCVDWLYTHHIDFRGLIEKGLALEAPEDMYNY